MANKAKWEEKYEEFKKYDKVEDLEKENLKYRIQMAGIKDQNSSEYKELSKKSKNINKQKNSLSQIKSNIPMVEKIKERRDVYQELLDELLATEKENENLIQTRIDLDNKSRKLDAELAELNQMIDNCKAIMKSDKESEHNKTVAAKMLKVHEERKNKNQLEFSETQLKLSKHLENPLKQVSQDSIKELQENIKKDNRACELLMAGKTMNEVIAEQRKTSKPKTVEQKVTKPEVVEPESVEPEIVEPEVVEPEVVEPEVVEPEVVEPESVEPEVTEPKTAEPEVIDLDPIINLLKYRLVGIDIKDKKYEFKYSDDATIKFNKLGFFKSLPEKFRLVRDRKSFGINLRTALKADPNITRHLIRAEKDAYLEFMQGDGNGDCFNINYIDKKGMYAKLLNGVKDKWAQKLLEEGKEKNGNRTEGTQKGDGQDLDPKEVHEKKKSKYEKMFGEGFDQHENPPQPPTSDKETQEQVAETVNEILNENSGTER